MVKLPLGIFTIITSFDTVDFASNRLSTSNKKGCVSWLLNGFIENTSYYKTSPTEFMHQMRSGVLAFLSLNCHDIDSCSSYYFVQIQLISQKFN